MILSDELKERIEADVSDAVSRVRNRAAESAAVTVTWTVGRDKDGMLKTEVTRRAAKVQKSVFDPGWEPALPFDPDGAEEEEGEEEGDTVTTLSAGGRTVRLPSPRELSVPAGDRG